VSANFFRRAVCVRAARRRAAPDTRNKRHVQRQTRLARANARARIAPPRAPKNFRDTLAPSARDTPDLALSRAPTRVR